LICELAASLRQSEKCRARKGAVRLWDIKLLNHRKTMVKNGLVNSLADAAKHIAEAQMELVNSGAAQNAAENVSKKVRGETCTGFEGTAET